MLLTKILARAVRRLSPVLLILLGACSRYTHVADSFSRLYTEADSAKVGYESWPLWVTLKDSRRNVALLRPIPGTAYIWNDSKAYKLIFKGAYFDHGQSTAPKENQADTIAFKFYGTDSNTSDPTPPLALGTYNISIQFNGSEGINTLCGSFRLVSEIHMITSDDLH